MNNIKLKCGISIVCGMTLVLEAQNSTLQVNVQTGKIIAPISSTQFGLANGYGTNGGGGGQVGATTNYIGAGSGITVVTNSGTTGVTNIISATSSGGGFSNTVSALDSTITAVTNTAAGVTNIALSATNVGRVLTNFVTSTSNSLVASFASSQTTNALTLGTLNGNEAAIGDAITGNWAGKRVTSNLFSVISYSTNATIPSDPTTLTNSNYSQLTGISTDGGIWTYLVYDLGLEVRSNWVKIRENTNTLPTNIIGGIGFVYSSGHYYDGKTYNIATIFSNNTGFALSVTNIIQVVDTNLNVVTSYPLLQTNFLQDFAITPSGLAYFCSFSTNTFAMTHFFIYATNTWTNAGTTLATLTLDAPLTRCLSITYNPYDAHFYCMANVWGTQIGLDSRTGSALYKVDLAGHVSAVLSMYIPNGDPPLLSFGGSGGGTFLSNDYTRLCLPFNWNQSIAKTSNNVYSFDIATGKIVFAVDAGRGFTGQPNIYTAPDWSMWQGLSLAGDVQYTNVSYITIKTNDFSGAGGNGILMSGATQRIFPVAAGENNGSLSTGIVHDLGSGYEYFGSIAGLSTLANGYLFFNNTAIFTSPIQFGGSAGVNDLNGGFSLNSAAGVSGKAFRIDNAIITNNVQLLGSASNTTPRSILGLDSSSNVVQISSTLVGTLFTNSLGQVTSPYTNIAVQTSTTNAIWTNSAFNFLINSNGWIVASNGVSMCQLTNGVFTVGSFTFSNSLVSVNGGAFRALVVATFGGLGSTAPTVGAGTVGSADAIGAGSVAFTAMALNNNGVITNVSIYGKTTNYASFDVTNNAFTINTLWTNSPTFYPAIGGRRASGAVVFTITPSVTVAAQFGVIVLLGSGKGYTNMESVDPVTGVTGSFLRTIQFDLVDSNAVINVTNMSSAGPTISVSQDHINFQ